MKNGLVLGKFMPLHTGHVALIGFAKQRCDHLYILLCYTANEEISGDVRRLWLEATIAGDNNITLVSLLYNEDELLNTSVSSKEVSYKWAAFIKKQLPSIDIIFSSEPYGDYVAEFMQAQHIAFDIARQLVPISASQIRQNPFANWHYLPQVVKPFFVKKIALLGTESTGKSMLSERLAKYFNTVHVPEMAREIIEHTEECLPEHLHKIAALHAETITAKTTEANKILICDTDILITKSYSYFLFGQELATQPWMEEANKMDLYFFLESDCPFVQDGTRLPEDERNSLSNHHKNFLIQSNISFVSITGNWDERFEKMCGIIQTKFTGL